MCVHKVPITYKHIVNGCINSTISIQQSAYAMYTGVSLLDSIHMIGDSLVHKRKFPDNICW